MNNEKNTLVVLTPGFAASESDSTCLPMHQLFIKTLKETYPDLQVIVLAFHYPFEKKHYRFFNADVYSFAGKNKTGLHGYLLRRKVHSQLKKLHDSNKIIGLLSFWYGECAYAAKKFAAAHDLRHYCWILGQDAREKNFFPKRLPPSPNELIALSDFLQEEFERNHGVKPLHVIPPGIHPIGSSVHRDIDMLGVGSLIPLKQYEIFIEVVAELKKTYPRIKTVLVGEGSERKKLEQLIMERGVQENITLTGEMPHHEVLQRMQRSKIFVHPSSYEGFSGVCMEALSAGMQVISFCKAMNRPIAQWHIVNDQQAMKQKTYDLLQNEHTRYEPITAFKMEETVRGMMALFKGKEV